MKKIRVVISLFLLLVAGASFSGGDLRMKTEQFGYIKFNCGDEYGWIQTSVFKLDVSRTQKKGVFIEVEKQKDVVNAAIASKCSSFKPLRLYKEVGPHRREYSIGKHFISLGSSIRFYHTTALEMKCKCSEHYLIGIEACESRDSKTSIDWKDEKIVVYPSLNHNHAGSCNIPIAQIDGSLSCSAKDTNTSSDNPINCATGQKHYTETDYRGFGLDPLTYTRYYSTPEVKDESDSVDIEATPWSPLLRPTLTRETFPDGAYTLVFKVGKSVKRIFFFPAGSDKYQVDASLSSIKLSDDKSTVTMANGMSFKFNVHGLIASTFNMHNEERYSYTYVKVGDDYKVQTKSNRFGRSLTFDYYSDRKLKTITDQDGVTIHYTYDAANNLKKVIYPDNTPEDLTDNPFKEYLFENEKFTDFVTGILNENGERIATIRYHDNGKARSSELSNGIERVEVSYPEDGKSIVKFYRDVEENTYREEEYSYGKFRGRYRLTSKRIVKCEQCELTTETWEYNTRELLQRHTSPAGIVTEWTYDGQFRKRSETVGVGKPEERKTSYTWSDRHNKIEIIETANEVIKHTFDANGNIEQTLITPVQ